MVKLRRLRNAEAYVSPSIGSSEDLEVPAEPGEKQFDVSEVIEMFGFGKYQWKVVLVMGLMSFADSCEIWLSTIILKMLVCEWGLSTIEMALIPATVLFFYAIGSIIAGKLSDKMGRWPILLIAYYIICVSGTLSAFASSYIFFIIVRSFTGFGIGATYGVSVAYTVELVPKHYRSFTNTILSMFWIAGSVYECIIAVFVMGLEHGWRIQVLLTVVPCFFTLFFIHFRDESPRYLVITQQAEQAKEVLERIAKENGHILPPGEIIVSSQRRGEYIDIYKPPFTQTAIVVTIIFFCNMWLGYGAVFLVPDMMSYGYCSMSMFFEVIYVTSDGCINYTRAEYLFFLVVIFCCIPGYIIGPWTAEKFGRLPTFYYTTWGSLFATVALEICIGPIVIYLELLCVAIFYMALDAVLWIYIPEYFPTFVRSTAVGFINGVGKIGGALGVLTTLYLDTIDIRYTIATYIVIIIIAIIASFFLETETRGRLLADGREGEGTPMSGELGSSYGAVTEAGEGSRDGEEGDGEGGGESGGEERGPENSMDQSGEAGPSTEAQQPPRE